LELFYDLLFDLIDGSLLIIEFSGQEGLLLAYPSPRGVLINEAIQKIFMAKGFTLTETGHLYQNLWYLFRNLISLLYISLEMVGIECFRESRPWVSRLLF